MKERERERGSIDPLIPVPLPVSVECQDLLPGKTNHKAEVTDVAIQDPTVLPSGWPTLYISHMHSKLNLHLEGIPGPHPAQMQPKTTNPNSPNGFDLSFPGLLCKADVDPCSECQNVVTVTM